MGSHSRKGQKVVIGGVEYPSQLAAARALGVSQTAIHRRIKFGIPMDRPFHLGQGKAKPVTVWGKKFKSLQALARQLHVSHQVVEQRLKYGRPLDMKKRKQKGWGE